MKFSSLYRALQASALASAALLMLPAGAQTHPAADAAATETGTTAGQAIRATTRAQNRTQRAERRNQRHPMVPRHARRHNDAGEPPNANRLATDRGASAADYERNALARCEVFKTHENRMACVERMRQTPQGSVEGGGLLWEFSYQVPAEGS